MPKILLSASQLKKQVETKAYAYGMSSVVSALLGEYVVELLRQTVKNSAPANLNS
ncbi:MAG: hypothetical protein V1685_03915 [Parcubacteria group bacterium]